jgi:hypothetical protein
MDKVLTDGASREPARARLRLLYLGRRLRRNEQPLSITRNRSRLRQTTERPTLPRSLAPIPRPTWLSSPEAHWRWRRYWHSARPLCRASTLLRLGCEGDRTMKNSLCSSQPPLTMCGRVIQSSGPLRLAIVDGLNVSDSRMGNNAAPSQEQLVIRQNHLSLERWIPIDINPLSRLRRHMTA